MSTETKPQRFPVDQQRPAPPFKTGEDRPVESLDVGQLHAELHGLIMMPAEDSVIRESFRKRAMEYTNAVGVAHLTIDDDGQWDLKPGNSTGRVPRRNDFVEKFGKSCVATFQRQAIQLESFLGLQAVFVPVNVTGVRPEVMLFLTKETDSGKVVFIAEIILEYFALWLKERNSCDNAWKLTSLAALIELISEIEKTDNRVDASQAVANEIVRYLNCDHVAVGLVEGASIKVKAIAGQAESKTSSRIFQLNETALSECWLRDEIAIWPPDSDENVHLLLSHKQLAKENDYSMVVSSPLTTPDGKVVGAVLVGCKQIREDSERLFNFLRAAAPRLASAVEVVSRAEVSRAQRMARAVRKQLATIEGRIWLGLAAVTIAVLCFPVSYRVRCNCELNAAVKQLTVAPFDGVIHEFFVEPGDHVENGQLLARMDGHAIQFQLASVYADLAKAKKQRDIELNKGDIPNSIVADLEAKSLAADKDLLRHQQNQIEIRSPFEGVVLADKFENTDGASVSKGDVLFEIGTFDPLSIEINVPAEEIAHVFEGQPVKVWIDGYESEPFTTEIQCISPRSEMRESRNVFVANIKIDNSLGRLRPGMKGNVRIDTEPKTLMWNLFHKPWNFVVSRLTWW